MNSRVLLVSLGCLLSTVAGVQLCVNNDNAWIKDLKIDEKGQLFYIDATNSIFAVRANCGQRVQIHPIPGRIGLGPSIKIPTALTIGRDAQGRRGLYVANLELPHMYFIEFNFETFQVIRFSVVPIQAVFLNELETAANGDLYAIESKQAIIRYNVIEQRTTSFVGFAGGPVDIYDLAITQECPFLLATANDNNRVYFCALRDSETFCRPIPEVELSNPSGIDMDCNCNIYVASQNYTITGGTIPTFNPLEDLFCPQDGRIVAPAHINEAGHLTSLVGNSGSATYEWLHSGILWAKTRCQNGNSDSWFVNGQRWNVPITTEFTWSRVPVTIPFQRNAQNVFSSLVRFDVREPRCEIAQLFLGQVPDFLRVVRGFLDKKCSSQYVCASEFCLKGASVEIITTTAQGPALRAPISSFDPAFQPSTARILFPDDQFASNPTRTLWLETFCPDGSSDSWFINGVRVNIPITQDFTWHAVATITDPVVTLAPREANCRVRGAFAGLGPAKPVLPYSCDCCTENTDVYFSQDGNIFQEKVTNNLLHCFDGPVGRAGIPLVNTPGHIIDEVVVFSTCTFQPTAPIGTLSNTPSPSSTRTPSPTPSSTASNTASPSSSPSASRPVQDVLSFSTIFAAGHDTGGASQGNQQASSRTFVSGRGLVTAIVLLRQVGGVGAQNFVRFVGTTELGINPVTHFRLYSATANMRLIQCPVHTPMNSLSQFLQDRIVSFITSFPGAPTSVASTTTNVLFIDDVAGIGCVPPVLNNPVCGGACIVPNKVRFTWGLTWALSDSPCIVENGQQVCLQPFSGPTNTVFVGFNDFRSHVVDPSTSLQAKLQVTSQVQVVRTLFPECSTTKANAGSPTGCAPAITAAEVGSGANPKSANFCFQGSGFQNTCTATTPSNFGCFCDECCYAFGDCCPDVEFCDSSAGVLGNECHVSPGSSVVDPTLPACRNLCGI